MATTMEIVRYRVAPGNEAAYRQTRDGAIDAVRQAFPGMIRVYHGNLGGGEWLDVVLWESLEDATRAAEGCEDIDAFRRWTANISEIVSMEHATVEEPAVV